MKNKKRTLANASLFFHFRLLPKLLKVTLDFLVEQSFQEFVIRVSGGFYRKVK
jgi:hypothetical protein